MGFESEDSFAERTRSYEQRPARYQDRRVGGRANDARVDECETIENEYGTFTLKWNGELLVSCTSAAETLVFPETVRTIDREAVDAPNAKVVVLPKYLKHIQVGAFSKCVNLESIDFTGEGAKIVVNTGAFDGCKKLHVVIGRRFFPSEPAFLLKNCTFEVVAEEGSVFAIEGPLLVNAGWTSSGNPDVAYMCVDKEAERVEVPQGVRSLEVGCFAGCDKLKEVVLPDTLENIKKDAFADCTSLATCVLPELVSRVELSAFWGCSSLNLCIPWYAKLDASDGVRPGRPILSRMLPEGPRSLTFDERSMYYVADDELTGQPRIYGKDERPQEGFVELAFRSDEKARSIAAKELRCGDDAFAKLAQDENPRIRQILADNVFCPTSVLEILAAGNDAYTRKRVAVNENCPAEVLRALYRKDGNSLSSCIVFNPNCPLDLLMEIAEHSDARALEIIAAVPNCPVELMEKLSASEDSGLRYAVAMNDKCPAELLKKLTEDEDPEVKRYAARKLNRIENEERSRSMSAHRATPGMSRSGVPLGPDGKPALGRPSWISAPSGEERRSPRPPRRKCDVEAEESSRDERN